MLVLPRLQLLDGEIILDLDLGPRSTKFVRC
jgi:hypothetical protein